MSEKINILRRVLVVVDDREMASSLAALLGTAGYEVEMAFDGAMAMEAVEQFSPEICLVDLNVPGLNVYELASRLRELLQQQPLLGNVTPFHERDEWDSDAEFGLDFTKPSDPNQVVAQLLDFLRSDPPKMSTIVPNSSKEGKPRMPEFRREFLYAGRNG